MWSVVSAFYEVEYHRYQYASIIVEADTPEAAQECAGELAYDADWDDDGIQLEGSMELRHPPRQSYWTGGERGHWVHPQRQLKL